jgi:cation diffusion facilitator CzcD-associated flavoprotein CzcO
MTDIAVIGAGPAGVSVALSLCDRGLSSLLIERGDHVGSSWRGRYDRLKLNTGRPFSHLPNRPYPKGTAMFPTRDDVVAHLDRHAHESGIELRLDTEVTRIDRQGTGWRLETSTGEIDARQVVVAIGHQHTPRIPDLPGAGAFTGEVLHSSDYRNPRPFQGKTALVVGSGSSGMEIAHDLATGGAAKVWLAIRTPPNIMLRSLPGGLSVDLLAVTMYRLPPRIADAIGRSARRASLGDLSEFGLPIPEEGAFTRGKRVDQAPTLVDMDVIDAIKDGSIEVVAAVDSFDRDKVVLADGSRLDADTAVLATGYRRGLEPLVGHLGVLDAGVSPSLRECGPPRKGCGSSATTSGRRSSVTWPSCRSAWRSGSPANYQPPRYSDSSTMSGASV